MKYTKLAHRVARSSGVVQHGLLLGLTMAALLVADPAMAARRGKGGLPPGVKLVPVAQPAPQAATVRPAARAAVVRPNAQAAAVRPAAHAAAVPPVAQAAAVRPDVIKPILHPGRHGSKPRAGAR